VTTFEGDHPQQDRTKQFCDRDFPRILQALQRLLARPVDQQVCALQYPLL